MAIKTNHSSHNIPALRFPGFEGTWEKKKLGEIAKISSGGTPNRAKPSFWNGIIPWVSTTLVDFNTIYETEECITEEGLKNSSAKIFPEGTLLMAMYGQGKTRGKIAKLGIEATTNQACAAIIANNTVANDYLFQNLAGRYDEIRELSNSGGQQNLSAEILKSIIVTFPSLPEQQKIASFFTAIDKKIAQLKQQKEKLELYKKGVMQQIFNQQLRFKTDDGKDFPEWEEKKLGEICEKKASNISANSLEGNTGEYKIYGATGLLKYVDFYSEEKDYISIVKDGAGVGRVLICESKSSVLGTLDVIRNKENANLKFLFYFIQKIDFTKYITGSTIPHIYFKDYSKELSVFPSLEEQTKISNFLSAIDEKINKVQAQIQQTVQWKKGLLQQMFV